MTFPRLTRETLSEGARALRERDPRLGAWIDRVGPIGLRRHRHRFGALCRSIISQQLGAGAARTIHSRFVTLFAPANRPEPGRLLDLEARHLRRCGLSRQKLRYLRALALEFHTGGLRTARLGRMPDEQVIELLTEIPGIGRWTAEMFLIFSLGRLDVFSSGDLALRAAVERVVGRALKSAALEELARRWSPYRSVACLYLWKVAHWKDEPNERPEAGTGRERS